MELIEVTSGLAELATVEKGCVLTIGNFDGVHIGHQHILNAAKQAATENQAQLVVMTFEPHPLAVLRPRQKPELLTSLALKKHLIAKADADYLLLVKSTPELLSLTPDEFVERFISKGIQPGIVVEGESFNFGSGRDGNVHTLQQMGEESRFLVSIIEAKEVQFSSGQTIKISSTLIRDMLKKGSVSDAALALGRPYRLIGRIVPGRGIGKQLGFPTANMAPPDQLVPAEGVYAGFVKIADSEQEVCAAKAVVPAALSIGRTQTLGADIPLLIEAHLLIDDVGELYDKWLAMDFIELIREQRKFDTEKDLSDQITKDCEKTKAILGIS
ncbi:MAG: bifunctional riboflavin kinase/FAD synthetase [Phycisphaerae bacterium]|nr:bifunctional riboflavin kinase/FAD synthetase [Phycisphaerae bacterium]NIP52944.1 bifunctional riboflavin kinase/FAD synthetase [Phycisphaerae bacterium]NIS51995.1 bifunctional riboflavin kinase/FAD synthetase [Phycisphaerae bacterium]NIU09509.1 bifunctional riboflavin kinase/FAD synthetase [Phycisphaerae bacterium]NIU58160.1 bifunctional riboflavin kinase/FAD synthetase [Phycisphaerae bacterium]